jgi:hypothetical protein
MRVLPFCVELQREMSIGAELRHAIEIESFAELVYLLVGDIKETWSTDRAAEIADSVLGRQRLAMTEPT